MFLSLLTMTRNGFKHILKFFFWKNKNKRVTPFQVFFASKFLPL
ncbi:hypothetical protein pah_c253o037 [Parachlamydia acanthamoebae str. Hall's coccus]|nr:hypothetical protein pah_c253o037 [Parachlamydia acanthamoebae str. Hall's coccus]